MKLKPIVQKHPWRVAVLLALVGAVAGLVIASALPTRWSVATAYTINQRQRQAADKAYSYDGYYALEAAQLFTDTLIGWFATPSVAVDIYREAGLPLTDVEAAKAASGFRSKRFSSQIVTVRFSADTKDDAQKLASAAAKVITQKTAALNLDEKGASLFTVEAAEPVIAPAKLRPPLAAGLGLLLGAFLGYLMWFATADMKKPLS